MPSPPSAADALGVFHPAVREWFTHAFEGPTAPQALAWPPIGRGESTLLLAPTGSGKTLAAFLWCIDRLMFTPAPDGPARCRVLYVSPLKALAVDVERNLRAPLAGIANLARARGDVHHVPAVSVRTGDTPANERARFAREPADILITTPESLYLLLTSNSREALRAVDTVIVDEIHALVPTKRGAHLALSLERLESLCGRPLQRIGLSATQRPLDEVARFLGGSGQWAVDSGQVERAQGAGRKAQGAQESASAGGQWPVASGQREHARGARRKAQGAQKSASASGQWPVGSGQRDEAQGAKRKAQGAQESASDSGRWPVASGQFEGAQAARREAQGAAASIHDEFADTDDAVRWRPVTIVDAGARKQLELRIEVPVEDMARLGQAVELPSGPASQGPVRATIWTAIHPRLLQLVRAHRSTLIFVNSRRVAERLAAALNELAEEPLVRAHHGSLARAQRIEIEDALKAGQLRGLVATSSLELGIDMGAIDLVVQIEAPPSIASGLQRIGRGGHHVGAVSRGIVFPKYRGDLVACAAATRAMQDGQVEATRYPRNPLDVLAQQIVAMAAMGTWPVDQLFDTVRRAAPYATLARTLFEGVLDMLSGRYPSDDFAELRPRITWDRVAGTVAARESARRVAIVNGGTIPDRGLYGVFLAGASTGTARVGELDEEMVFESRVGETFLLGASSWRIEEITHDRVLVSPAPGEPGKMPFWKGEAPGRPLEFGRAIGALTRTLAALPAGAAVARLTGDHALDPVAAENLLQYLGEQRAATHVLPDDGTIVVERCRDELGEWRVCVLSPFGGRVLAPWSLAVTARIREQAGLDAEVMWTDDGFVVRLPETDEPPDVSLVLPPPEEAERLVLAQLGSSALFAAKFRECAGRALLLPRRRPGQRTPLWQQRKRAYDLLQVAARYGSFPMLLETYRECLRDLFDMPALLATLRGVAQRTIRVATVDTTAPSPFAASLLFGYVANYIYDGDAPLAERRAQALTIDQSQLRELLGEAELRELLDADVIDAVERELQHLDGRGAKSEDSLHDLLLRLGDLTDEEIAARSQSDGWPAWADALVRARRAVRVPIAGTSRVIAVEDAARYRDAVGAPLPHGLPESLLGPARDPLASLALRFARTHGPFTTRELAARFGVARRQAEDALRHLAAAGKLLEGEFRPGGQHREWCEPGVLTSIRRRSLAKLRREVEPVEPRVLGRFVTTWQGITRPRSGLDALLDAVEHLQGAPIAASILETDVLPARVAGYTPADLDTLIAAGEVVWAGVEPLGDRDGRLALYLTDAMPRLWRAARDGDAPAGREAAILDALAAHGAMFFPALHDLAGGGFPGDTVDALWTLAWRGLVTNDSLHALRAFTRPAARPRRGTPSGRPFRSRRAAPPAGQGRWSLVRGGEPAAGAKGADTSWAAAVAQQLLTRHGIVTREMAAAESIPGGFGAVYDVYRAMEDRGRVRRGYFTSGVGAVQFALPAALDLLRSLREDPDAPEVVLIAATDPANPYGAVLKWPATDSALAGSSRGPTRSVGASVVLVNGALTAYLGRGGRPLLSFLPEHDPDRSAAARAVAARLVELASSEAGRESGMLIAEINGMPAQAHPLGAFLQEAGFVPSAMGLHVPRASTRKWEDRPDTHGKGPLRAGQGRRATSNPFAGLRSREDG